jgi:hypothetical protein
MGIKILFQESKNLIVGKIKVPTRVEYHFSRLKFTSRILSHLAIQQILNSFGNPANSGSTCGPPPFYISLIHLATQQSLSTLNLHPFYISLIHLAT